jgi:ferredoxin
MDLIDLESGTDERSRLSCQVEMTDALDGLVVQVAPF